MQGTDKNVLKRDGTGLLGQMWIRGAIYKSALTLPIKGRMINPRNVTMCHGYDLTTN